MARVTFTPNLERHVSCPPVVVAGAATLGAALSDAFASNPLARDYVLDDQGGLRRHMIVFIDGEMLRDREKLSDKIKADSEIYVMQALSGG